MCPRIVAFALNYAAGIAVNRLIKSICLVDIYSLFIDKEHLTAAFRRWPLSCKQFISGHFVEYHMTL